MKHSHAELIKSLRLQRGISQLVLAKKLGISRPSYISLEQGKRDIGLAEAELLCSIFGIGLTDLGSGIVPNYEKYKQMILAYLREMQAVGDDRVPKTKLAKLLYLADFAWFYENLKSMSGMAYRRIQFGPVPDSYFRAIDELAEEGTINIDSKSDGTMLISATRNAADMQLLSTKERKLITKIAKRWKNKRTQEIVKFTHDQLPYRLSRENEFIPYELIIQENPGDVY